MTRRPPGLFALVSLLLCVLTLALWARTHFASDWLFHNRVGGAGGFTDLTEWCADTGRGTVRLAWASQRIRQDEAGRGRMRRGWKFETHGAFDPPRDPEVPQVLGRLGFDWTAYDYPGAAGTGMRAKTLRVPLWMPALLFAAAPARRAWRRARRDPGRCRRCGYDLRATPGHCPECGTAAPPPAVFK